MAGESNKNGKKFISNDDMKKLHSNINVRSITESNIKENANNKRARTSNRGTKRYIFTVINSITEKKV